MPWSSAMEKPLTGRGRKASELSPRRSANESATPEDLTPKDAIPSLPPTVLMAEPLALHTVLLRLALCSQVTSRAI